MFPHQSFGPVRAGVLFSYAFRPFFLLIGLYAMALVSIWVLFLVGVAPWPDDLPARVRHGHEMIFGFAGGAIAGFLLTAVATWTSRPPVQGPALMLLCAVWIAARIGGLLAGPGGLALWGYASLAFWGGLLGLMARELIAARNVRNYKVLLLLLAFPAVEAVFFLAGPGDEGWQEAALRTGLFLVLGMVSLIGGRIIPAFTQNWLRLNRPEIAVQLPSFDRLDLASVGATAVFAVAFVLWPHAMPTGALGLLAASVQALRVARWRGWLAARESLLWVLHVGYAWMPAGFALLGTATFGRPELFDGGLHALGYGAVGTLILGVAARVSLGHTGRPLRASPAMSWAFALVTAGTLCRVVGGAGGALLWVSAGLWVAAYALFVVRYAPILVRPRPSGG